MRSFRTTLARTLSTDCRSRTGRYKQTRRWLLTSSYVEGPTTPLLETRSLPAYFATEILDKYSDRPALICRQERPRSYGPPSRNLGTTSHLAWDFEEFDTYIRAVARGLLSMGVSKGDRVAVIMGNNSAYATLQWACASIGAILVTINPAYRIRELVSVLNHVEVNHLFVVPCLRSSRYVSMLSAAFPELRNSPQGNIQEPALPTLRNFVVVENTSGREELEKELYGMKSAIDWREIMLWNASSREEQALKIASASLRNDEAVNIQFTSGTTGSPKAVQLTSMNLLNNGLSIGRCMHLTCFDILCNVPPLFHCFVLGNLAAWSHGSCIVYPSEIFDPKAVVDAVVGEKCTALHGVPTHFLGVLSEVERRLGDGEILDLSHLRTGIAAGSSTPIELMKKIIDKLHLADITNAYGMTETSPVSFQTTPADTIIQRVETVGKVHPHVRAKIINGKGEIVPIGTPGEVCVTGYSLQKGYWNDEVHTRSVMRTDPEDPSTIWMHTGDEGIIDEEGYLKIVGRIKDIIIRGGENLFPVQIEDVLMAHSAVREGAAVSVPDDKYGEVVGLWIVLQPNQTLSRRAIREFVAEHMNPQNAPAWVWFVGQDGTPDELPKTASGKVMKHILREWSRDLARRNTGRVQL